MENYLSTLTHDPKWTPKIERLRAMNLEELEAFHEEEHTGVEHNVAEHFLVEKLVADYAQRRYDVEEEPFLTAFVNQKHWTEAMWRFVGEDDDLFGKTRAARLKQCAMETFEH